MVTRAGEFLLSIGFIEEWGMFTERGLVVPILTSGAVAVYGQFQTIPFERLAKTRGIKVPHIKGMAGFFAPAQSERLAFAGWKIAEETVEGKILQARFNRRVTGSAIISTLIFFSPFFYPLISVKKKPQEKKHSQSNVPQIHRELVGQVNEKMYALLEDPENLFIQADVAISQILELRAALYILESEGELVKDREALTQEMSQELAVKTAQYDVIQKVIETLSTEEQLVMNERYQGIQDQLHREGTIDRLHQRLEELL